MVFPEIQWFSQDLDGFSPNWNFAGQNPLIRTNLVGPAAHGSILLSEEPVRIDFAAEQPFKIDFVAEQPVRTEFGGSAAPLELTLPMKSLLQLTLPLSISLESVDFTGF